MLLLTVMKEKDLLHAFSQNKQDLFLSSAVAQYIAPMIPHFHHSMMSDQVRNQFYFDILRKNVQGKTVLEIGTGAGLLSMMCARLGAKHVYTCELNPALHYISKQTFADNGLQKDITAILGDSRKLKLGRDIPKRVDLIVSELFGNDGLVEDAVPVLHDAKRFLVKGGKIIPEKVTLVGQICRPLRKHDPAVKFQRFNLDTFNDVWNSRVRSVPTSSVRPESNIQTIVEIDFNNDKLEKILKRTVQVKIKRSSKPRAFCFGFQIQDGKHKIGNLGLKKSQTTNSWGVRCIQLLPSPKKQSYIDFEFFKQSRVSVIHHSFKTETGPNSR